MLPVTWIVTPTGILNVETPVLVSIKLPVMVMLVVIVTVTPFAMSIRIFPVKLAAGGHAPPPVEVQAIAEKFLLGVTVNGFDVQVG
jgi:hypothetical protein